MERDDFQRWHVTGTDAREWEVVASGLGERRARELARLLTFSRTHVSARPSPDPSVTVLHERTGPPYADESSGTEWTVFLRDDAGRERQLFVRDDDRDLPIVAEDLGPGARIYTLGGRPAVWSTYGAADDAPRHLTTEPMPGVLAALDVHDDLAVVERLMLSLVDLPRDDPRLRRYAVESP
jgi:hypothetical protein